MLNGTETLCDCVVYHWPRLRHTESSADQSMLDFLLDLMFLVTFGECLKDKKDSMNIIHSFLTLSTAPTRARSSGLSLNLTHTLRVKHFYFNRIVRIWNHTQPSTFTLSKIPGQSP